MSSLDCVALSETPSGHYRYNLDGIWWRITDINKWCDEQIENLRCQDQTCFERIGRLNEGKFWFFCTKMPMTQLDLSSIHFYSTPLKQVILHAIISDTFFKMKTICTSLSPSLCVCERKCEREMWLWPTMQRLLLNVCWGCEYPAVSSCTCRFFFTCFTSNFVQL